MPASSAPGRPSPRLRHDEAKAVEAHSTVKRARGAHKVRAKTTPSVPVTGPTGGAQDDNLSSIVEADLSGQQTAEDVSLQASRVASRGLESPIDTHSDRDTASVETMSPPSRSLSEPLSDSPDGLPAFDDQWQTQTLKKSPSRHRATSRTVLPQHSNRRSVASLDDWPIASFHRTLWYEDSSFSDSGFGSEESPSTPRGAAAQLGLEHEVARSAERQQYRSWRQGKAKINGMSIADSQRRKTRLELGVDKIIDAQLPKPEPSVTNVRSRKTSHYLGLFKDHEVKEQRHDEKHRDTHTREFDRLDTIEEPVAHEDGWNSGLTAKEDRTPNRQSKGDTAARKAAVHNLPLDLLEDIRNHHHLRPSPVRKPTYQRTVPARDTQEFEEEERQLGEQHDEESDREHISSATYFPHQGLTVEDSPTDDHMVQGGQQKTAVVTRQKKSSSDVDISLRSDDSQD